MGSAVKYKSFSHWFSYHWGWFLGGAALLLLLACSSLLSSGEADADYVIGWVGAAPLSQEETDAISAAVARAGADQNGDGQVITAVNQYLIDFSLTPDDYGYSDSYSYLVKLMAQLQTNECYLYLLEDPETFQRAVGVLQYLDGTVPSEADGYEAANWERMCVPWQPEGLTRRAWLGRRALFSGKDAETLFPGSDALFDALAADH